MRSLALSAMVVVVLLPVGMLLRRSERRRARLDGHGLDDLGRIYRRANPRGTSLDPRVPDQQRTGPGRRGRHVIDRGL